MPKKRKGKKSSKFARMSEEERIRYLQHRAELELEAKRRKQQLMLIFMKNKLEREKNFSRINNAKINEKWRAILRKLKCIKLKDNTEYLWKNFEEILKSKDDHITKLLDGLLEINFDYKKFQESHAMIINDFIEKGKERINYLRNNYNEFIKLIENTDMEDLRNRKNNINGFLMYLRTVTFAKNKCLEEEIEKIKTNHIINIHTILYDKNDSISKLKGKIYPVLEFLWKQLNEIINNYENSTEDVRKQYENLKKQDDVHQRESKNFPKIYTKLKKQVEAINNNFITLVQEREECIEDLKLQSELLTKRVFKLRQKNKIAETTDAEQLKRLSVTSNDVIKDLQKILDKSIELQTITKLCFDIKMDSFNIKEYSVKNLKNSKTLINVNNEFITVFNKIEGFRDHLLNFKEENNLIKQEHKNLIAENNKLKHRLRSYLVSSSRIPTICPITQI